MIARLKYFYQVAVAFSVISMLFFYSGSAHATFFDTVANFEIGGRVFYHDEPDRGWWDVPTAGISTSSWSELEGFMDVDNYSELSRAMRYPFAGGYLVTFNLTWTANFPFHLEKTETGWDYDSNSSYSTTQILTPYADKTDPYDPDLPESYPPFAEFFHDGDSFQIAYREDGGGTFTGTLSYTLYQDGDPSIDLTFVHICPDSKHISSTVPIPAGIWLMGSGLLVLIGLRNRRI